MNKFRENEQFYTKPNICLYIWNLFINFTNKYKIKLNNYYFIEPSAGSGNFLKLLPKNKRLGLDLLPNNKEIIECDYFRFKPFILNYIIIGNPPFGLRGETALKFINHSSFADIICFILPQGFESNGKSSLKNRVKNHKLVYSEKLPSNSFIYPNGNEINIETVVQIWIKKDQKFNYIKEINKLNQYKLDWLKIISISNGKTSSQKRNINMINKCDLYLSSTCFSKIKIYDNFDELPYKRGYGIIVKNKNIINKIKKIDFSKYSFKSTNSANNIRKELIEKAIYENFKEF